MPKASQRKCPGVMGLLASVPPLLPAQRKGLPCCAVWPDMEVRIKWRRSPRSHSLAPPTCTTRTVPDRIRPSNYYSEQINKLTYLPPFASIAKRVILGYSRYRIKGCISADYNRVVNMVHHFHFLTSASRGNASKRSFSPSPLPHLSSFLSQRLSRWDSRGPRCSKGVQHPHSVTHCL